MKTRKRSKLEKAVLYVVNHEDACDYYEYITSQAAWIFDVNVKDIRYLTEDAVFQSIYL